MIEINNLTTSSVDEEFLKKTAQEVLKNESVLSSFLSIVLVGSVRIKKLNKKYRKKNRVTDVLSFGEKSKFLFPKTEEKELGEIVICLREVKENAKRFNLPFEKELARVLIHGILHLLGYDHEKTKKEAEKMKEKEEYYLSQMIKS